MRFLWPLLATEARRSLLATAIALLTLPFGDRYLTAASGSSHVPSGLSLVPTLGVYQTAYVVLTVILLCGGWDRLRPWARRSSDPSFVQRFLLLSQPGAGFAVSVSVVALVTVITLVRSASGQATPLLVGSVVLLVVVSWVTLLLSFTIDYLCTDARHGWTELDFPGSPSVEERTIADYVYFAAAVSTTFGTTDVEVVGGRTRRTVTVHSICAFVFNTIILALAISATTSMGHS